MHRPTKNECKKDEIEYEDGDKEEDKDRGESEDNDKDEINYKDEENLEDESDQIISASSGKYSEKMTKESFSNGDVTEVKNEIRRKDGMM